MTQQTEKLAVLFADICGSTSLYGDVGDARARHLTAWCISTMLGEIAPFKGTLIKTIGDEIMCTFPDAQTAFKAACAMQNAVRDKRPPEGIAMHIRVGFHYGNVLCEANDVFGDTVNVAARVAGSARTDQIMTTQAVYDALPPALKSEAHQVMSAEFKGKQEKYPIYLVVWEEDNRERTRFIAPPQPLTELDSHQLTLRYNNQVFKIKTIHCKGVVLGRSNDCDIIVSNGFASRQHVRVEPRFGKFYIVDQSTNGTFIRIRNRQVLHITREEKILEDAGFISLGQNSFDNTSQLIEYSIDAMT